MTQDEIIEMARQAGFNEQFADVEYDWLRFEAFAKLAVAKEREAIIQIIKAMPFSNWFQFDVIEAIRARGQA